MEKLVRGVIYENENTVDHLKSVLNNRMYHIITDEIDHHENEPKRLIKFKDLEAIGFISGLNLKEKTTNNMIIPKKLISEELQNELKSIDISSQFTDKEYLKKLKDYRQLPSDYINDFKDDGLKHFDAYEILCDYTDMQPGDALVLELHLIDKNMFFADMTKYKKK